MKTAVVTYIYPEAVQYVDDFIGSLNRQTFTAFKLLVFNDAVENADHLFRDCKHPVEIINLSGSVSRIRFDSFDILRNYGSDFFIFQDVDDTMSENRVEVCTRYLTRYNVVCNDLTITDAGGKVINFAQWKNRLGESFEFDVQFLMDKNILGFTNTAIRKALLQNDLTAAENITAADWYIFSLLLFKSNSKAVFTSQCQSNYRQHEQNIGGIGNVDRTRLIYVLKVKKQHYHALSSAGINVDTYLSEVAALEKKVMQYIINGSRKTTGMFWWEETEYLYEKN